LFGEGGEMNPTEEKIVARDIGGILEIDENL
jgi:hypothetical protein